MCGVCSATTASSCCLSSPQQRWTCTLTAGAGATWPSWPATTRMAGGVPFIRACLGLLRSLSSSTLCWRLGGCPAGRLLWHIRQRVPFLQASFSSGSLWCDLSRLPGSHSLVTLSKCLHRSISSMSCRHVATRSPLSAMGEWNGRNLLVDWFHVSDIDRFVGGLSGLHTFFTSTNRTTYEHFRARVNGQGNPYDVGCPRNWLQVSSPTTFHLFSAISSYHLFHTLHTISALSACLHSWSSGVPHACINPVSDFCNLAPYHLQLVTKLHSRSIRLSMSCAGVLRENPRSHRGAQVPSKGK